MKEFILTDGVIPLKINRVRGNQNLKDLRQVTENSSTGCFEPPLEVEEIINLTVQNETERIIIDCITQGGYSNEEIAEKCGKKPSRTSQIKHKFLDRLFIALQD